MTGIPPKLDVDQELLESLFHRLSHLGPYEVTPAKEEMLCRIEEVVGETSGIAFACLYGSFLEFDSCRIVKEHFDDLRAFVQRSETDET